MTPAGREPGATAPPRIEVADVGKSYPTADGPLEVIRGLSLEVASGEFVSVVGPSGCGKSTLLSILAGTEATDCGTVTADGEPVTPDSRRFAWMPQSDTLFQWRSVLDNVALGAQVAAGLDRSTARERAIGLLDGFGLSGFASARPSELSGDMRQRVAFARTVAQGRGGLLLDEPFGALDALTRTELQLWLEEFRSRERWTVVLVTHDVREAVLLSDRVVVLSPAPTSVREVFDVALPRPRTLESLADPEVTRLEADLLRALEVGKH